jgi:hypothetical protein
MTADDYTDPTKWMELPANCFSVNRYRSIQDGQTNTNPIPKFIRAGNHMILNPEWESAEWEDIFIPTPPKPQSPGKSGFDLED